MLFKKNRCMAGVALGPSELVFVGDTEKPDLNDISHLESLRVQENLTPLLTAKSKIFTVLCEAEKEKIEGWRQNLECPLDESLLSPRSPRSLATVSPGTLSPCPLSVQRESDTCKTAPVLRERSGVKSVTHNGATPENSFAPEAASPRSGIGRQETSVRIQQPPKPVEMRCFGLTFITDVENNCIQVVRADGKHIRRFGSFGKELGQFNAMQGILVDDEDMLIYVVDTYNHRIQVFEFHSSDASDLKFVRVIGKFGSEDGLFNYPVGMTVDRESKTLIVADTGNDRIQILTMEGEHMSSFGLLGKHETNSNGVPLFKLPYDVTVIARQIYVTDHGNHRIQVLTMDGKHVRSLGSNGTKTGMFVHPRRLMKSPSGLLMVSDQENNRVQILSADCDVEDTSFT